MDATGSGLVFSTYLGGSRLEFGFDIAVDGAGSTYVTGSTGSTDFPTTAGAVKTTNADGSGDAFVTKLDASGSRLVYSTYLGGSFGEVGEGGFGIAVDGAGSVYVTGSTSSADFPTTAGAAQTTPAGDSDAFVTKIATLPTSTDECKNGGWKTFGVFKNQGDCVSFVASQGKKPSSLP